MASCLFPVRIVLWDHRSTPIYVGCGKCYFCLQERRKSWFIRNLEELRNVENVMCTFVTLTYDDDSLPHDSNGHPVFVKRDVQLFLDRFRKKLLRANLGRFKYFLVSEYGDQTGRPHYHALFYHDTVIDPLVYSDILFDAWRNCKIEIDWHYLNEAEISYCANYVLSYIYSAKNNLERPFMLSSRRPAIGFSFLDNEIKVVDSYRGDFVGYSDFQNRYKLPRYYKDKIFNDDEKFDIVESYLDWLKSQEEVLRDERRRLGTEKFYRKRINDFWNRIRQGEIKLSKSKHKL